MEGAHPVCRGTWAKCVWSIRRPLLAREGLRIVGVVFE